jgi:hypothetical protein
MHGCAQVRVELRARHVICVCSSYDSAKIMAAARRLLANAQAITAMVDLTGARAQRPSKSFSCTMCPEYLRFSRVLPAGAWRMAGKA